MSHLIYLKRIIPQSDAVNISVTAAVDTIMFIALIHAVAVIVVPL